MFILIYYNNIVITMYECVYSLHGVLCLNGGHHDPEPGPLCTSRRCAFVHTCLYMNLAYRCLYMNICALVRGDTQTYHLPPSTCIQVDDAGSALIGLHRMILDCRWEAGARRWGLGSCALLDGPHAAPAFVLLQPCTHTPRKHAPPHPPTPHTQSPRPPLSAFPHRQGPTRDAQGNWDARHIHAVRPCKVRRPDLREHQATNQMRFENLKPDD